jgi:hypothetical protein
VGEWSGKGVGKRTPIKIFFSFDSRDTKQAKHGEEDGGDGSVVGRIVVGMSTSASYIP